jgi:hypothetical protein
MPEKISPGNVMPEAPAPAPPTRSLRASARSTNPQARMQELLREGTAPARAERRGETPGEGNNEGNFIVSDTPMKEEAEEVLSEDAGATSEEAPHTPPQVDREEPAIQAMKQGGKTAPAKASPKQPAAKQSLKDAVLEEGRAMEERVSKTRLNVDIDEDLHFWLKGHAIQNRRKLNDLIPRILKAYRDEVEGE